MHFKSPPQKYKDASNVRASEGTVHAFVLLWLILYRKWFLVIGALAMLATGLDAVILVGGSMREAYLLIFAAMVLMAYAVLGRQAVSSAYSMPTGAAFRGLLPFEEVDRN